MDKVYPDAANALAGVVKDGQTIAVGGFGLCGIPEALIAALRDSGATLACRNPGRSELWYSMPAVAQPTSLPESSAAQ